jgi:plastocyanin
MTTCDDEVMRLLNPKGRSIAGNDSERTMGNSYKILGLIGIVAVAGLLITACTSSNATQSDRHAVVKVNPSSNPASSEMANMNMTGSSTANSKTREAAAPNQVMIENFSFAPATITVKAGTKVTWINHDDVPHTVDENDKRFKSGTMDTDDQYSFTFTSPGTFNYFCALHPKMTGQVIVK